MILWRRLQFGDLASLSMLDLRSSRDEQAASPVDPELNDPDRTVTGPGQRGFLLDGLADTGVQWKLVGNPVMIAPVRFPNTLDARAAEGVATLVGAEAPLVGGAPYNLDQWDGYPAERSDRVPGPASLTACAPCRTGPMSVDGWGCGRGARSRGVPRRLWAGS
ncbi:alkaline phosphatase D family protein [Blastococcus sp. SYSU DS0973]